MKWSKTSIESLLAHTLRAYEIFLSDKEKLENVYVLRYEEFVLHPQESLNSIFDFLGLEPIELNQDVSSNVNDKYYAMWEEERSKRDLNVLENLEQRAQKLGYSLQDYKTLPEVSWIGERGE
jgi:hypothetical protein